MTHAAGGGSRRWFLWWGFAGARLLAQQKQEKQPVPGYPPDVKRYADPATDLDVYRLTSPEYSSTLPAYYNRAITRTGTSLLFCCDRGGTPQVFRMDLRNGETWKLSSAEGLDGSSIALTPDNRSFCYFAGRDLFLSVLEGRARSLYRVPDGWERGPGSSVGPDGAHAAFAEMRAGASRLQMVSLAAGSAHTVLEVPFAISHPIVRPLKPQVLFRQEDSALWLVNTSGGQKRQLALAPGRVGPANWTADGKTVLYLNLPGDPKQLIAIREHAPDTGADTLVAKTSQYGQFGFNGPATAFVGASRSAASPTILVMLRASQRERTLCEHKASDLSMIAPRFAPDSQRIYFASDRDGKPAIYSLHVETLFEKTSA